MLTRKIDKFLEEWKNNIDKNPLIIRGSRQIGKTTSVRNFGKNYYENFIEINFLVGNEYKQVFKQNSASDIIKELSIINRNFRFVPKKTLIFFDEVQAFPEVLTFLKFFKEQGDYDVICSGSLLGINYQNITSISVGYKTDYMMYSMDFEEFLWAKGYKKEDIEYFFGFMKDLKPLPLAILNKLNDLFVEYLYCGGMPKQIETYIKQGTFNNVFKQQEQLYNDYREDISQYVVGLGVARVINFFNHITSQLSKQNHKFQFTKLPHGARYREYMGCDEWLKEAGIINVAYNLNDLTLPLKGNEIPNNFRVYYADTSLLLASLDEETKKDYLVNKNFNIYNGVLFENVVSEALIKSGYKELYFYLSSDSTIELDFVIRVKNEIVPIEVKAKKGRAKSLNKVIESGLVNYGVKLSQNNIGFDGKIFTFPYSLAFLLKRFFNETDYIKW